MACYQNSLRSNQKINNIRGRRYPEEMLEQLLNDTYLTYKSLTASACALSTSIFSHSIPSSLLQTQQVQSYISDLVLASFDSDIVTDWWSVWKILNSLPKPAETRFFGADWKWTLECCCIDLYSELETWKISRLDTTVGCITDSTVLVEWVFGERCVCIVMIEAFWG